jgi:hypothetical protein
MSSIVKKLVQHDKQLTYIYKKIKELEELEELEEMPDPYKWAQRGFDINGDNTYINFGDSIDLSDDGTILAVGAFGYNDFSGQTRIYKWNNLIWEQMGNDIDGENSNDSLGDCVSLSANGLIVAIGIPGINTYKGQVRIYEYNGVDWIQKGFNIDGESINNASGIKISLSSNGLIVAIGAYYNNGTGGNLAYMGHVRIYEWNGVSWIQKGSDIDGENNDDFSGASVSLSSNGLIVAIGADYNDGDGGNDVDSGHVRIYEWNGVIWIQKGSDIDGKNAGDFSGYSVSLSSNGLTVAIGAPDNNTQTGQCCIYEWNGASWIQKGNVINGENTSDESGISISLSSNGLIVAIGAHYNDGNGQESGHIRIYEWDGIDWIKKGIDIDGGGVSDGLGHGVSLSSNGLTVASSGVLKNTNTGYVSVYKFVYI